MDKSKLFEKHLPEAEVETDAGTIRVRGLSRAEIVSLKSVSDADALENRMLELALIEPKLTAAEVRKWRDAWTATAFEPVTDKIAELSGMTQEEASLEASFPE